MQKQIFGVAVLLIVVGCSAAVPSFLVEDEDGQQYQLIPILNRQRRSEAQGFGEGGATSHGQGGVIGFTNPNGSGGKVSYSHQNGYGHTVGVDAMVPVWSNKNRFGESTLNLGGGATQHFGGPAGDRNLDKRVGFTFNHRW